MGNQLYGVARDPGGAPPRSTLVGQRLPTEVVVSPFFSRPLRGLTHAVVLGAASALIIVAPSIVAEARSIRPLVGLKQADAVRVVTPHLLGEPFGTVEVLGSLVRPLVGRVPDVAVVGKSRIIRIPTEVVIPDLRAIRPLVGDVKPVKPERYSKLLNESLPVTIEVGNAVRPLAGLVQDAVAFDKPRIVSAPILELPGIRPLTSLPQAEAVFEKSKIVHIPIADVIVEPQAIRPLAGLVQDVGVFDKSRIIRVPIADVIAEVQAIRPLAGIGKLDVEREHKSTLVGEQLPTAAVEQVNAVKPLVGLVPDVVIVGKPRVVLVTPDAVVPETGSIRPLARAAKPEIERQLHSRILGESLPVTPPPPLDIFFLKPIRGVSQPLPLETESAVFFSLEPELRATLLRGLPQDAFAVQPARLLKAIVQPPIVELPQIQPLRGREQPELLVGKPKVTLATLTPVVEEPQIRALRGLPQDDLVVSRPKLYEIVIPPEIIEAPSVRILRGILQFIPDTPPSILVTVGAFRLPNMFYGRTWCIGTPGNDMIQSSMLKVKSVRWVAPSAIPGAQVIIRDVNDNILWEAFANGPHEEVELIENWWMRGFKVPTLTHGALYITLEY
jgi:hypothetical protein